MLDLGKEAIDVACLEPSIQKCPVVPAKLQCDYTFNQEAKRPSFPLKCFQGKLEGDHCLVNALR